LDVVMRAGISGVLAGMLEHIKVQTSIASTHSRKYIANCIFRSWFRKGLVIQEKGGSTIFPKSRSWKSFSMREPALVHTNGAMRAA